MIVNAFKQVCDRRHREVFFTNVPQVGTFQIPANTEMLITYFCNFNTSTVILKSVCLFQDSTNIVNVIQQLHELHNQQLRDLTQSVSHQCAQAR